MPVRAADALTPVPVTVRVASRVRRSCGLKRTETVQLAPAPREDGGQVLPATENSPACGPLKVGWKGPVAATSPVLVTVKSCSTGVPPTTALPKS